MSSRRRCCRALQCSAPLRHRGRRRRAADPRSLDFGSWTIGKPLGNVTATVGSGDDMRKIQISAPVHQDNSGGPALNRFGNEIGVIQSKQVAFASCGIPQNVNFAIKSMIALNFLEANGVEPPITVRTTDPMDGAAIAVKARDFTVQVVCH
ncbi:S1C family serine protease [Methylobacterium sp. E-065]|uniref:S1C family serine protease n=1 Tax=Methylobacterium sp. E-065 TaxID=2836583 RepID=UPI001FB9D286|nr:S1C family serine protease [Methylobacterium sp. E-065]MCJ2019148.1 S1C family serine protease [Methylobacterium sp. E-065]